LTVPDPRVLVAWSVRRDARLVATSLATELLGRHPGPLHHRCPTCGSIEHGQPSFDAPVAVSIAHAREVSVVAVSTAGPIGIDVEAVGAADHAWVLAEARAKAHGVGLTTPVPDDDLAWSSHLLDVPDHLAVLVMSGVQVPAVEVRPAAPADPAR
jgi:phosphopantetheinyl transferase